ncbi:MAG: F0F1 ATP synthase subunit epsilon [Alphaproteobacteria bacterium]|nr:F0F1 ATP synthase subunit epsilon [Alphaproteobacteria bacterium]
MADKVAFELVSPEKLLLSRDVDFVVVPGAEGDFAVLPGHAPFLSSLRPGIIEIHEEGNETTGLFVAGGFAEATPERCTVLANEAIPVADLDRSGIERRQSNAKEDLQAHPDDDAAKAELATAEAMLAALDGWGKA